MIHNSVLAWTHPQTTVYHTPSLDCHQNTPFDNFTQFKSLLRCGVVLGPPAFCLLWSISPGLGLSHNSFISHIFLFSGFNLYRWISAINLLIRQLQRTWVKLFLRCRSNALEGMAGAGLCTFSRLLPGCCTFSLRWLALESWFLSCLATGCLLAISYPLVKRRTWTVLNWEWNFLKIVVR